MDLPIALDRRSTTPLAGQLAAEIRAVAARGQVRVGERLPSTRSLAATLRVSRAVTAAAYEQLFAEGWITARRGAGTFVAAVPAGDGLPVEPAKSGPERDGRLAGDLRPGSPWAAGLRSDMWRRAWRSAADAAVDGHPVRSGSSAYRTAIAEHVVRHRGLVTEPGAVLATGGTTAAVIELTRAVLRPGDAVAVEEPGYPRAVGAFRTAGIDVIPARVDNDGLLIDELPGGVRAVYCTPAHQFPLGGTLPAARRLDLIAWARENDAWIVEDDYDGELRYDVAPLPLLASLGQDVVIYLGTASKIVTPTLGCGWLVAPQEVVSAVLALREETGTGPSLAGQRVFTALVSSGDLARHLRRVRTELAARRELVVDALQGAGHAVLGDRAGAHVAVPLADGAAERSVLERARASGLLLEGLARCHAGPPALAGLTLGYASPPRRVDLIDALRQLVHLRPPG